MNQLVNWVISCNPSLLTNSIRFRAIKAPGKMKFTPIAIKSFDRDLGALEGCANWLVFPNSVESEVYSKVQKWQSFIIIA